MKYLLTALMAFSMATLADTTIYYADGTTVSVPDSWTVNVSPKGFNNGAFSLDMNPSGQLPGYGGWPLHAAICDELNTGAGVPPSCSESPFYIVAPEADEPEVDCDFSTGGPLPESC